MGIENPGTTSGALTIFVFALLVVALFGIVWGACCSLVALAFLFVARLLGVGLRLRVALVSCGAAAGAVGVTLVIARRSAFEAVLLLVEDWLPGYNPHSNLSPSPLYVAAWEVVLIVIGIVLALSLSPTAIEVF